MQEKVLKILIADDDSEDLEIIEQSILTADPTIQVQKFSTGKAAIDYLTKTPQVDLPGLVILDFNMPEMRGSDVLAELSKHERFHNIPKFILSTSSLPLDIARCLSYGAKEYFIKPDSKQEMDILLKKIISFAGVREA